MKHSAFVILVSVCVAWREKKGQILKEAKTNLGQGHHVELIYIMKVKW